MILYPAIDLRQGRCVRLTEGRFDRETSYDADPVAVARRFAAAGATHLHVVDLDGAETQAARQSALIRAIAQNVRLVVQAGGGLRTEDQVAELLDAGVARAVVGSVAVRDPALTSRLFDRFDPERIALALDVRIVEGEPRVEAAGWRAGAGPPLPEVLDRYEGRARFVLCTDIGRDGTLAGPNVSLYRRMRERYPHIQWIASGGVGSLVDLRELADAGVYGAVVGKALYENRFSIGEAMAC